MIFVTGKVVKAGNTSVSVDVTVQREVPTGRETLVTGEFIFCSFDLATKKAVPHGVPYTPAP